jgi:hypothetical protein
LTKPLFNLHDVVVVVVEVAEEAAAAAAVAAKFKHLEFMRFNCIWLFCVELDEETADEAAAAVFALFISRKSKSTIMRSSFRMEHALDEDDNDDVEVLEGRVEELPIL